MLTALFLVLSLLVLEYYSLRWDEQVLINQIQHHMKIDQYLIKNMLNYAVFEEDIERLDNISSNILVSQEYSYLAVKNISGEILLQRGTLPENVAANTYRGMLSPEILRKHLKTSVNHLLLVESTLELSGQSVGSMLIAVDLSRHIRSLTEKRNNFLSLSFLIILISVVVMILLTRYISQPLGRLQQLANNIIRGKMDVRLQETSTAELQAVSQSINHMLDHLREREILLSLTLDSIGDALLVTDADGRLVLMNPVAEKLTGWTIDEVRGKAISTVMIMGNDLTNETVDNPVYQVLASGDVKKLANHTVLNSRYGKQYNIADTAAPIFNEQGEVFGAVIVVSDVSETYAMRRTIEQHRKRLQGILDDMQTWIIGLDVLGHIQFINNTARKSTHLTEQQALGKYLWELPLFSGAEGLSERIRKACSLTAKGQNTRNDIQIATVNGEQWIDFGLHPVCDETGGVVMIVAEGSEITGRYKIMQREKLRSKVLEMIADNYSLCDTLTVLVTEMEDQMSNRLCSILLLDDDGKHLLTGAGPSLPEFYMDALNGVAIGPEVGSCGTAAFKNERVIVEDIQTHPYWEHYKDLAAQAGLAACWSEPIRNPQGKVLGTFAVYNRHCDDFIGADIKLVEHVSSLASMAIEHNQLAESLWLEQQLNKQILCAMVDATITINHLGEITSFNPASEQLFGYTKEEIVGKNISILMPEPHSGHHFQYLCNYYETGEAKIIGKGRELEGLHKNGRTFPIWLSVAEISDPKTKERCFVGTCHDLTRLKEQELQLRRSQKMDALGELTGGIAHDYNNMLGVILGYAQILAMKLPEGSDEAAHVRAISQAAERSRDLTKKLLSFSRFQPQEPELINVNELILDLQGLLQKSLTPSHTLRLNLVDEVLSVRVNKGELEDTLLNFAINAKYAMPNGGAFVIESELCVIDAITAAFLSVTEGRYLKLTIVDNGVGMDEATQSKIFDPFFTTKGEDGTGLGLSQVYGFIQRSQGAIKVYSEPGKGTKFDIYIPLVREQVATAHIKTNGTKQDILGGQCQVILVVDDEPALTQLACDILGAKGYRVISAENGEEALQILAKEKVDLVLSDILMPKMDGYELLEAIDKLYPGLPVQLTSGFAEPHKHEEGLSILLKPYEVNTLLACVHDLLD